MSKGTVARNLINKDAFFHRLKKVSERLAHAKRKKMVLKKEPGNAEKCVLTIGEHVSWNG